MAGKRQEHGEDRSRGGRVAVSARVLDVAEDLFASRPYGDVTVRQIAAGAGVSHALVHRYLGGKLEILRAVIARDEAQIAASAKDLDRVQDVARAMLRDDLEHLQRHLLLVIRAVMDGVLGEITPSSFPATRLLGDVAIRQAAGAGGKASCAAVDPRFAAATVVALTAGWFALEEPLLAVLEMDGSERAAIDEQLLRVVGCLLDATVPG
jgi:AcrR family transcriptional regulator